jgi:hypothetical protein
MIDVVVAGAVVEEVADMSAGKVVNAITGSVTDKAATLRTERRKTLMLVICADEWAGDVTTSLQTVRDFISFQLLRCCLQASWGTAPSSSVPTADKRTCHASFQIAADTVARAPGSLDDVSPRHPVTAGSIVEPRIRYASPPDPKVMTAVQNISYVPCTRRWKPSTPGDCREVEHAMRIVSTYTS